MKVKHFKYQYLIYFIKCISAPYVPMTFFDFSSLLPSPSNHVFRVNFDMAGIWGRISAAATVLNCPV